MYTECNAIRTLSSDQDDHVESFMHSLKNLLTVHTYMSEKAITYSKYRYHTYTLHL